MAKGSKGAALIRRRRTKQGLSESRMPARVVSSDDESLECIEEESELPLANGPRGLSMIQRVISSKKTLFAGLITLRIFNAIMVQTWYVPDEYWQSLEVAHKMVFDYGYLTWEWRHGLRGYAYPLVFALMYRILAVLHLDHRVLLIKLPRFFQAIAAAWGDYYLFKLSAKLSDQKTAQWSLLCQLASWFTFYCCTRTLTNSMEAVFSIAALYYFPWPEKVNRQPWKYLCLVAAAVIVRPTAAIMWLPLCLWHLSMQKETLTKTLKTYIIIGISALAISLLIDGNFYGRWVFVQYNFLEFNVLSGQGSFYGTHPWHWYWTQGFPVIMTTHLIPFTMGVWTAKDRRLFYVLVWTIFVYSFLSHKEFRFIYPVLPIAMHYCGSYLHQLCVPVIEKKSKTDKKKERKIHTEKRRTDSELSSDTELKSPPRPDKVEDTGYSSKTSDDSDREGNLNTGKGNQTDLKTNQTTTSAETSQTSAVSDSKDSLSNLSECKEIKEKESVQMSETKQEDSQSDTNSKITKKDNVNMPRQLVSRAFIAKTIMLVIVISNLFMGLYFSLVHQRGTLEVMKSIHDATRKQDDVSVLFLMPCHSTPYYSFLHKNISLRFLTCEPNLQNIPQYHDEADIFFRNPRQWLDTEYINANITLPSHVVIFNTLQAKLDKFFVKHSYHICSRYFHTHFPEGNVGNYVYVLCR